MAYEWTDPDAEADAIERQAGIAEPPPTRSGIVFGLILPVVVSGIVLLIGMWFAIRYFHLLG
ncbi:hypothetical protein AA101099_1334 [Neoasaia chiangmaiensis NBRC 101099]|uniref:Uncharacterized protein n=1 Tax=Neoasaia chiangmaiensis TaxID=320497 RepID=A0A1U9KQS3_9PROT|nr:hypothetical protein [Neoasaia chiangmaiensis]AQS88072.1 hypothetical protein A0U93_09070 [Neoasaia chiangmaiensis]GBR38746.1 hypothetical protein AA101099_1334 [Neoasaia chiangmaiensis NBRC 101099]GEN15750.1 hypothetical protein NCH01_21810 [Neoasaia chiangmaiensis]